MPRTKYYTNEQLAATRQLMQEAAARGPRTPDRYTRQEFFQELHAEFDELRRQGFTNVQIAEIASQGLGDVLGAQTLQKFLSPTKRRKRKKGDDDASGTSKVSAPKPTAPRSGSALNAEPQRKNTEATPDDARYLRERS